MNLASSRSEGWWVAGLLLAVGLPMAMLRPWDTADEWWFLQVVSRVLQGQSLYRDVFVGVTPLSVWVTALWMTAFGESLFALRALGAVLFACIGWVLWRLSGRLDLPAPLRWVVLAAYVVIAPPTSLGVGAPYTPLALLFLLSSVDQWVAWMREPARKSSAIRACLLIGLCAASKQNMGLLAAMPATYVTWWWWRTTRDTLERKLVDVAAGLCLTAMPVLFSLGPVLWRGHFQDLLDFTVRNKGVYLQFGSAGFGPDVASALARRPVSYLTWAFVLHLLPCLSAVSWVRLGAWKAAKPGFKPIYMLLLMAWIVSVLAAFPRPNSAHLPVMVPMSLLGIALSTAMVGSGRLPMNWAYAAFLLVTPAFALALQQMALWQSDHGLGASLTWRGVLVHRPTERALLEQAAGLKQASGDLPTMLLMPNAALFYQLSGLHNPSRFDYPLISVFGPHGQNEVRSAIVQGRIKQVCLNMDDGPLTRYPLVDWVRQNMTVQHPAGPCVMHALPSADG